MTQVEIRASRGLVTVRSAGDSSAMRIGGYAAKFNKKSQNLGGFVERIAPGFFNKSAGDGWPGVMARWNHEDAFLLGTTQGKTLRLALDDEGLDYEVDLPESRRDVFELVERGDVHQSSFAFIAFEDDWALDENDFPLRTLVAGKAVDVAPVNTPAYLDTSTGLRSLAEKRGADLDEVFEMAKNNELKRLLTKAPLVIDLGARSESPTPIIPSEEQAPATPKPGVSLLLRQWDLKNKQR
jgi:uncharacterized protein